MILNFTSVAAVWWIFFGKSFAQELISVFPTGGHATGGEIVVVTGYDFNAEVIYECNFGYESDFEDLVASATAQVISNELIECVVPEWNYFSSEVNLWLSIDGIEVGEGSQRLDFTIWESWIQASPIYVDASGGDTVEIVGAGFELSTFYKCVWSTGLETLESILSSPVDYKSIACISPDWESMFSPELRNIKLYLYRVQPGETDDIEVPYEGEQFFFSFSAGYNPWSQVIVSSSDIDVPSGHGVYGGDIIEFFGQDFDTEPNSAYYCLFSMGSADYSVTPNTVNAQYILCTTPNSFTFEGIVTITLQYNVGSPPLKVQSSPDATKEIYGVQQTLDTESSISFDLLSVFTLVNVEGGVLSKEGGRNVIITGKGYDPRIDYSCSWVGTNGYTVQTPLTVDSTADTVQCITPNIEGTEESTFQLTITRDVDMKLSISLTGTTDMYTVGESWISKDIDEGIGNGNEIVNINGVGFSGTYLCVFGNFSTEATVTSEASLKCSTPVDYPGNSYSAGTLDFSIISEDTGEIMQYGGTENLTAELFEFHESWNATSSNSSPIYSSPADVLTVIGSGFSTSAKYFCAFIVPECIDAITESNESNKAEGIQRWDREVDTNCYIFSDSALFLSSDALLCTIPLWPFSPTETRLTVMVKYPSESFLSEIGQQLVSSGGDKFYFSGVSVSASPSSSNLLGGSSIILAAAGLSVAVDDYVLKWSGANSDEVVFSDILSNSPTQCDADVEDMSEVEILCIEGTAPLWPFKAGEVLLTIFSVADGTEFSSAPFIFMLDAPPHYQISASFYVDTSLSSFTLAAQLELRYWLGSVTGLFVNSCQIVSVDEVNPERRRLRSMKSEGITISVILATLPVSEYTEGLDGASYAAEYIAEKLIDATPSKSLASLGGAPLSLNGDPLVVLMSSECPDGSSTVVGETNFYDPNKLSCTTCPKDTFTTDSKTCEDCPRGSLCAAGTVGVPPVAPGFWRNQSAMAQMNLDFNSYSYYSCLSTDACLGGLNSECSDGIDSESLLCSECQNGFYPDVEGGLCDQCGSISNITIRFYVFASTLLLVLVLSFSHYIRTNRSSIAIAISFTPELYLICADSCSSSEEKSSEKSSQKSSSNFNFQLSSSSSGNPVDGYRNVWNTQYEGGNRFSVRAPLSDTASHRLGAQFQHRLSSGSSEDIIRLEKKSRGSSMESSIQQLSRDRSSVIMTHHIGALKPRDQSAKKNIQNCSDCRLIINGLFLVLLSHCQLLSALRFSEVYWLRWTTMFSTLLSALKVVDLDPFNVPSMSMWCMYGSISFYAKWLLSVFFLPTFFAAVLLIRHVGTKWIVTRNAETEAEQIFQLLRFRGQCVQFFWWVALATLPGTCRRTFQLVHCVELDDSQSYLWNDLSIECSGTNYYSFFIVNLLTMAIYMILLPAVLLWKLRSLHNAKNDRKLVLWLNFRLFSKSYKSRFWWFEVARLYFQLVLTGPMVFVAPRSSAQFIVALLLSVGFLVICLCARPFRSTVLNIFQVFSASAIVLTHLLALVLQEKSADGEGSGDDTIDAVCFAVNVLWICLALLAMCYYSAARYRDVETGRLKAIFFGREAARELFELKKRSAEVFKQAWKWEPISEEAGIGGDGMDSEQTSPPPLAIEGLAVESSNSSYSTSAGDAAVAPSNDRRTPNIFLSNTSRLSDLTSTDESVTSAALKSVPWTYNPHDIDVKIMPVEKNVSSSATSGGALTQPWGSTGFASRHLSRYSDSSDEDDDDDYNDLGIQLPAYTFVPPAMNTIRTEATDSS